MSSYTKLTNHVVFSTKYRKPTITADLRERLYEYIGGVIRGIKGSLIEIGGVEDHIHLLARLPPMVAVSDAIRELKANASKWVNELPGRADRFEWQKGYGAFTVSYSHTGSVSEYIRNQREHHRRMTFREEYIAFLKRHNIEFEDRYLFEDEHHG